MFPIFRQTLRFHLVYKGFETKDTGLVARMHTFAIRRLVIVFGRKWWRTVYLLQSHDYQRGYESVRTTMEEMWFKACFPQQEKANKTVVYEILAEKLDPFEGNKG